MSKFKVGDLITDKKILVQIIDVKETHYTIKSIDGYYNGKLTNTQKGWVDNLCVKYDLDNPLTKTVKNGKGYCYECYSKLHYGDECVRYDGEIFCCENCLMTYIGECSEDSTIDEDDLDNSSTAERPLFDLTEEQIEEIKKEGNRK
ncbi:MAG: hypothetical protein RBR97_07160 [Bacteroidales bacterium]|nr:hypothetical protein [Bacteroidales bacterium]